MLDDDRFKTIASFEELKALVEEDKKTNVTLSGLKAGKRYYVRVQGFKKVGKTYYYGAWSKTVNVVIRKK